jgi:competence protein ComEA
MATRTERRALLFFGAVLALGAGVRFARAARHVVPTAGERGALSAQISAVDSQGKAAGGRGRRPRRTRGQGKAGGRDSGAANRPPRRSRGAAGSSAATDVAVAHPAPLVVRGPVDLDRAPASEIETLPKIGAALAQRIVADRESRGPFGSLAGLERVRGIGPKMVETLRGRVTFSGTARPDNAVGTPTLTTPRARHARRRGASH